MPSFTDILSKSLDAVEPPKNMPVGTYMWSISTPPRSDTISDGKYDVLDFDLICLGPTADVDQAALASYGTVQGKKMRHRFMFDKLDTTNFERNEFFLKQFLENTLKIHTQGKSWSEALAEVPGKQLLAQVRMRPDKTPGSNRIFDEIGQTAAIE